MQDKHDSSIQIFDPTIHSFDRLIHEIYALSRFTNSGGTSGGTSENSRDYSRVLALAVEDLQKRSEISSRQTLEGLFAHKTIRFASQFPQGGTQPLPSLPPPKWNHFARKDTPTFEQYNRAFRLFN